jgi:hypothetical protein
MGRIEHPVHDRLDPGLQRQAQIGLNKGEAHHA